MHILQAGLIVGALADAGISDSHTAAKLNSEQLRLNTKYRELHLNQAEEKRQRKALKRLKSSAL